MVVEMRDRVAALADKWRRFGHRFGFGIGIAAGHATLGSIGYEGRFQYSATGSVVNLGARLCAEADDGQIIVDGRVQVAVESIAGTEPVGELALKGFHRPVRAFNVRELKACANARRMHVAAESPADFNAKTNKRSQSHATLACWWSTTTKQHAISSAMDLRHAGFIVVTPVA